MRRVLLRLVLVAALLGGAGGAWAAGLLPCEAVGAHPDCQLLVTGGPVLDTADLLTVTPSWRYGHRNDPIYHLDEYREEELVRQLKACGFAIAGTARIRGAYDDLVVLAQRMD
ncbi:MAG: hypothetical protein ACO3RG_03145 [Nitriliruptoraceae bacterium]